MGGKAFAAGPDPLLTPRMPPAIYHSLLTHYITQLAGFFVKVAAPVEAPEKTSFGDIDIIVSQPKTLPFRPEQIAIAVNAKRSISSKPIHSFAVPYPEHEGSYVQLDVHICQPDDFDWEVFHESHGDLWNILGSSLRSFGLTANDTGLHLRIPEIEECNRKRALMVLTADPDVVLDFLQLDKAVYTRPFGTVDDMFEYACTTRFFTTEAYVRDGLKANDRRRMGQRDLYRRFVDEFVPSRTDAGKCRQDGSGLTRVAVLEEALDLFGKRDDFNARVQTWQEERKQLSQKQGTRQWRKEQAIEEEAYANAWIDSVTSSSTTINNG